MLSLCGVLYAGAQTVEHQGNHYSVLNSSRKTCNLTTGAVETVAGESVLKVPATITVDGEEFTVTTISSGAYDGVKADRIEIPATVEYIESGAFNLAEAPEAIYFGSATPADIDADAFSQNVYASTCLHIPLGAKAAYAEANGWNNYACVVDDMGNTTIYDFLKAMKAHVFMSPGDERLVTDYFVDVQEADVTSWEIADNSLIDFVNGDSSSSLVRAGNDYGHTVMTARNNKGDVLFHVSVYVCPTVTVKSPLGAIYRYHKIYNAPARIYLTHSDKYLINCVMHDDVDVTKLVEQADDDKDGVTDGQYISEDAITGDITVTITMEENINDYNDDSNGEVVGKSGLNLQVIGHTIRVVDSDTLQPACAGKEITIRNLSDMIAYHGTIPEDGCIKVTVKHKGAFNVEIEGYKGKFRIILQ